MKNVSLLLLITLLSFSCQAQQEDQKIVKAFSEMSVSYYFTSIYVKTDFNAVRNTYKTNRAPTETFHFKGRQIVHQSSKASYEYTLTSDIAINMQTNTMTFYVQQAQTCEEAAVFFYGDSMIIVDFLNGTRLICSREPIDIIKWRDRLTIFDKIKNK